MSNLDDSDFSSLSLDVKCLSCHTSAVTQVAFQEHGILEDVPSPRKGKGTFGNTTVFQGLPLDSQHPSPNVKTPCNFEPKIWLKMITSRDVKSACFKGSKTSCL